MTGGLSINGPMICSQAHKFDLELGISENKLKFSNGWLDSFKDCANLCQIKCHGEAGLVLDTAVALAWEEVQKKLEDYQICNIYNIDETGLFYCMPLDWTLASRQLSRLKVDKVQMTIALCTNADSSDIWKPLFIGHARQPCCFNWKTGSQLGLYYFYNTSAWMMGSFFQW